MAEVETKQEVEQVTTPGATEYRPAATVGPDYGASSATTSRRSVTRRVSGNETSRRVVLLLFGIVQVAILLRFVLTLLGASSSAGIVSAIHSFSEIFVGPFEGIFKTVASGFDVAALSALVGWTIIELLVLAILQIATRRPDGSIS